jgi:signal transduction histidine kinase
MMKRRIGTGAATGFLLASFILLLDAAVGYRNVLTLHENDQAVTHTHKVLSSLTNVFSTLKDAETGQRGFLITGEERYLEPYNAALDVIHREIAQLQTLSAGSSLRQASLNDLGQRIDAWLGHLDRNIVLRRDKGFEAVRQSVLTERSKEEMDAIRSLCDDMIGEKEEVLARRAAESRQSFLIARAAQAGGALLSLGILGLAYTLVRRELAARGKAEAGLRQARDELEQRVRERTAELGTANEALRRSNQDLEQFASIASHDLQEPLRKIQAFGDRLQHQAGDALGGQSLDYLARMRAAAARMRTLINDLLTFSRVTTQVRPFQEVDLAAIARDTVADLEGRIQQTQGRVELGELPTLEADPVQMHELFLNLIGNGLKFHRPGEQPVVRVGGRQLPENGPGGPLCELTVRDNGIGFEEVYRERIFEVFRRLHGRSEYEGTGIGLAICRKIVERHGGTIAACSAPGQGATFVVTLPVHQAKEETTGGQTT